MSLYVLQFRTVANRYGRQFLESQHRRKGYFFPHQRAVKATDASYKCEARLPVPVGFAASTRYLLAHLLRKNNGVPVAPVHGAARENEDEEQHRLVHYRKA